MELEETAAAFARDGDGLAAEIPAGAAMDHPLFPVVWPVSRAVPGRERRR